MTPNFPNTDPLLGPLADNGGPTPTMAPAPASPAVDAVSSLIRSNCQRSDRYDAIGKLLTATCFRCPLHAQSRAITFKYFNDNGLDLNLSTTYIQFSDNLL